jgi:glutaredoxin
MAEERIATLYRMKLPDHECPFGVRAKAMLDDAGWQVEEHVLTSREEVDAFKAEHGVATTPQVFIAANASAAATIWHAISNKPEPPHLRCPPGAAALRTERCAR